jgi:hypothetical protein
MKPVFQLAISALAMIMLAACTSGGGGGTKAPPVSSTKTGAPSKLAVGEHAAVKEPVEIPFTGTMELNYKTRDEVISMRRNMAERGANTQLIKDGPYKASSEVFDGLQSEKTWIGLKGRTFYGRTSKIVEGLAEQSRFICSPFMLVAADIKIPVAETFDKSRYNIDTLANSQYPVQCPPKTILFDAPNASEEIVFDVSSYRNSCNNYLKPPANLDKVEVSLVAYNARDFGYKWMYVNQDPISEGIGHIPRIPTQAFEIKQALGYSGGNNAMVGDSEEFVRWQIIRVPAKMVVSLWKAKPQLPTDKADFTVTIKFI